MAMNRVKFLSGEYTGKILYCYMNSTGAYHILKDPDVPGEEIVPGDQGLPMLGDAEDLRLVKDTDGQVCIEQKYNGRWAEEVAIPITDPNPEWPIEDITIPSIKDDQALRLIELGKV